MDVVRRAPGDERVVAVVRVHLHLAEGRQVVDGGMVVVWGPGREMEGRRQGAWRREVPLHLHATQWMKFLRRQAAAKVGYAGLKETPAL